MATPSRQSKRGILNSSARRPGEFASNRSALILLGLIVAAFFIFSYLERLNELAEVRAEIVSLRNDLAQAEQRNAELEAARQNVTEPAYIGETARAELGLIQPGDDPFVILGQQSYGADVQNQAGAGSIISDPKSAGVDIFDITWWRSLFGVQ